MVRIGDLVSCTTHVAAELHGKTVVCSVRLATSRTKKQVAQEQNYPSLNIRKSPVLATNNVVLLPN